MRFIKHLSILLLSLAYLKASSIEFTVEESKPLGARVSGSFDQRLDDEKLLWNARPATDADEEFLKTQIFGNAAVMNYFGDRKIRDEGHAKLRIGHANARFGAGSPHGSMIVMEGSRPLGWFIAGGGDEAGASEMALALIPQVWNHGYGASVLKTFVELWAPVVRRIGLGLPCEALKVVVETKEAEDALKEKTRKSFQCFGGKPLERLDATTSPDNIAMQKVLQSSGFQAAKSRVINPDEPKALGEGSLDALLTALYEGASALEKESKRYCATYNGKLITFSWSKTYDCIKLHYEYDVKLPEKLAQSIH